MAPSLYQLISEDREPPLRRMSQKEWYCSRAGENPKIIASKEHVLTSDTDWIFTKDPYYRARFGKELSKLHWVSPPSDGRSPAATGACAHATYASGDPYSKENLSHSQIIAEAAPFDELLPR
ncbi:unnamed protein product [Strongylus vulgaris]|uniref:Uncharacterized protein n=1 Tax=Strongylus vulgaris TaxID=40348 RepID=A0A3P7ICW8_STRVU|nr:unnamed protein product [Strongylus vulgaris]